MTIIREPGKFEGEPEYVRQLWEQSMDGADDEAWDGEQYVVCMSVTADDAERWPELELDECVVMWESDQGFVYHRRMTHAEWNAFQESCITEME